MLRDYLGADTFKRGIVQYLQKYSYKNTKNEDLWNSMASVSIAGDLSSVAAFLFYGSPSQRIKVLSAEMRVLFYFWFQICHTDGTQTMDSFCSRSKHSSSTSVSLSIYTHPPMHILLHILWAVPLCQTFWGSQLSHFDSIQIKTFQLNQLTAFCRFS